MPVFSYKAIGRDGRSLVGTVEADGPELATRQLRGQGLTLLKLEADTIDGLYDPAWFAGQEARNPLRQGKMNLEIFDFKQFTHAAPKTFC